MDPSRISRINHRFTEVGPPGETLSPDEYFKEPLVSLENALRDLSSYIIKLDQYIQYAKDQCNKSGNYGLKVDESAAIFLYTLGWKEGESQSLYYIFNTTLRSGNRAQTRHWFPYLKLLVTALMKFPSVQTEAWRNLQVDVINVYPIDKTFSWSSVTSCSRDVDKVVQCFWNPNGQNTLFKINVIDGKNISAYSAYPDEQEVVLLPGTRFRVTGKSVLKKAANCENIPVTHLEQLNF